MEADEELDQEMEELLEKEQQAKAEPKEESEEPQPEPEAKEEPETTPEETPPEPKEESDLDYVRKKGLDTAEKIARSYREIEKRFHEENQQKNGNPAPPPQPPQGWGPRPDYYPPSPSYQPPQRGDYVEEWGRRNGYDPEDAKRLFPGMLEIALAAVRNGLNPVQQELTQLRSQSSKNDELFQLMQDPAFTDPGVTREMHKVLESNPRLSSQPGGYTEAFNQAVRSAYRRQIQQGKPKMPPVTASGGNGSSQAISGKLTPQAFEKMKEEDQMRILMANEKRLPR